MIFLYHEIVDGRHRGVSISRAAFERQVAWLARNRRVVPLAEYLHRDPADVDAARLVSVTFDDGFRSTYFNALPFLQKEKIPATFFVTAHHVLTRGLLWFAYLNAVCYGGGYASIEVEGSKFPLGSPADQRSARRQVGAAARASGNPVSFSRELERRYPLSEDVAARFEGMRPEEVRALAETELFEVGSHTLTHPFLSLLSEEKQQREIRDSRTALSELCGREIRYFAYPAGDYDKTSLAIVRQAGYRAALATTPRGLGSEPRFEVGRVGIYAPSLLKVRLKAAGLVALARSAGIRVG
ncbi:MAG TPA: polysaccharide deacetylase family protein [Candidatus Methylomirabilis sp.]|nr:polysaccharide deacetylase family protein [Candidatus Methylomirabilis sp.]